MMPIGCLVKMNHDHLLLLRTLAPIALLFVSWLWRCPSLTTQRKANDQAFADQLLTMNFVVLYLLFPSNSANIFATWQCETLDEHPDKPSFLRSDFSVE